MDIPAALTRKIGPLPVWAWGGVVGGSVLAFRALTGGSGASPSPTQVTPGAPIDGDGGSGTGGGSGDTPQPWYTVIPGVGTIIDRPPGDVTIIPPPKPPATTPPPPTTTPKVYWGKDIPTAISTRFSGASAAAVFRKYKVNYGGAINLVDIAALFKKAGIRPKTRTEGLTKLGVRRITPTGDTFAYAEGDSGTPLTPQAIVPAAPILPLGQLPAAPTFAQGVYRGYLGPSIDAVIPIASSARVAMPPIAGGNDIGGTILRSALPPGIERPKPPRNRNRWTRGVPRITIDPIERIATPVRLAIDRRVAPKRLGTTTRLPTPAAQRITTSLDTRTRRNVSG